MPAHHRKIPLLHTLSRCLLLTSCLFALPALAQHLSGTVVEVKTGGTIILNDANRQRHTIHLLGIAAPKITQPHGPESTSRLSALLFQREVDVADLTHDGHGGKRGKLLTVTPGCNGAACPKTFDAGLMQITSGMAWWDPRSSTLQTAQGREEYQHAEFGAKTRRLGLWADKRPLPPWQWRGG